MPPLPDDSRWPELPYAAWQDTCATLHLWTQIVGKIRLAQTPWLNHSWHVPLYVNARGRARRLFPVRRRLFSLLDIGMASRGLRRGFTEVLDAGARDQRTGSGERFRKTVLNEFYRVAFRKKVVCW